MNTFQLYNDAKIFLEKLHPYCFDDRKKPIIYKKVQSQGNTLDCGVFSIAFAVTLLYGYKPVMMIYNQQMMRNHLLKIFETRSIKHFPCLNKLHNNTLQFHLNHESTVTVLKSHKTSVLNNKRSIERNEKDNVNDNKNDDNNQKKG